MKTGTAIAIGVALVVASAAVSTQQKPNFSGRWVQLSPAEGAGGEQVIQQTETKLTMNHDSTGSGHQLVFNLDGSEARSTMQSHGMDIVTVSKAVWKGGSLTITSTTTYTADRKTDQTMVCWIDEKGQLIIDLTQAMTGRPTETQQIVHRKR